MKLFQATLGGIVLSLPLALALWSHHGPIAIVIYGVAGAAAVLVATLNLFYK